MLACTLGVALVLIMRRVVLGGIGGHAEPALFAGALLEGSLVQHPEHLETLGNLGSVRMQQGRLEEARVAFERLLAQAPDDFVTWNNLGVLESRRSHFAAAMEHFQRALAIHPNYAEALRNLEATQRQLDAERVNPAPSARQGST